MTPSYLLFINHATPSYIKTAPCDAQLLQRRRQRMVNIANLGDAAPNATSQGGLAPLLCPIVHSTRKKWFCTWATEPCGQWAQSNRLKLCRKHQCQHDAASGLADISINGQWRDDEVAAAKNLNALGNQAINNEGLIDVNVNVNINATAVETLGNQAIDNERLNHVNVNAAVGNGNSELYNQQDSGDTRISDLDGRIIEHLNDQLRIRDGQIDDLEQRACHLQNMLHSMSEMSSQALMPGSSVHPLRLIPSMKNMLNVMQALH